MNCVRSSDTRTKNPCGPCFVCPHSKASTSSLAVLYGAPHFRDARMDVKKKDSVVVAPTISFFRKWGYMI